MDAHDIIIKPLLSEKTYKDIKTKKYWFVVAMDATKLDIKKAIEEIFKVKVENVNTLICPEKKRAHGKQGTIYGFTTKYKKAIVTLSDESKPLEFFESLSY